MSLRHVAAGLTLAVLVQGTALAGNPIQNDNGFKPYTAISPITGDDSSIGATGYVFVNGVGYEDGHMLYCTPAVGLVQPDKVMVTYNLLIVDKNKQCREPGSRKTYGPAVTAQQFLDELMDGHLAKVVSVGPVIVRSNHLGIIYYRETAKN